MLELWVQKGPKGVRGAAMCFSCLRQEVADERSPINS